MGETRPQQPGGATYLSIISFSNISPALVAWLSWNEVCEAFAHDLMSMDRVGVKPVQLRELLTCFGDRHINDGTGYHRDLHCHLLLLLTSVVLSVTILLFL